MGYGQIQKNTTRERSSSFKINSKLRFCWKSLVTRTAGLTAKRFCCLRSVRTAAVSYIIRSVQGTASLRTTLRKIVWPNNGAHDA